ncbi:hypothetical protein D3C87_129840 [compost metagenome]
MKKILICLILLFSFLPPLLYAQNFNEWFRQKKTQKNYLIQQIAALQVYKGALKKGYNIARGGLNTISDFKDGEFNLHRNYFDDLNQVSPYVKQYPKIELITKCFKKIYVLNRQANDMVTATNVFTNKEIERILFTWENVLGDSNSFITELETICSDGKVEMSDMQRTEHIDRIHMEIESTLSFAISFCNELTIIKNGRKQEVKDIRAIKSLNGLK